MWMIYATISALLASLVAILAKFGLKGIDSTLATTIRAIIMAIFLVVLSFSLNKFNGFQFGDINLKDWIFISLSGIVGALSWVAFFYALKTGPASGVTAIDKASIVLVVILAGIFLGESLGWKAFVGSILMLVGMTLLVIK